MKYLSFIINFIFFTTCSDRNKIIKQTEDLTRRIAAAGGLIFILGNGYPRSKNKYKLSCKIQQGESAIVNTIIGYIERAFLFDEKLCIEYINIALELRENLKNTLAQKQKIDEFLNYYCFQLENAKNKIKGAPQRTPIWYFQRHLLKNPHRKEAQKIYNNIIKKDIVTGISPLFYDIYLYLKVINFISTNENKMSNKVVNTPVIAEMIYNMFHVSARLKHDIDIVFQKDHNDTMMIKPIESGDDVQDKAIPDNYFSPFYKKIDMDKMRQEIINIQNKIQQINNQIYKNTRIDKIQDIQNVVKEIMNNEKK